MRRVLDVLQELCKVGERVVIFAQSPEQARFMGVRLGEELLCHILEGPSHRRCQILRSFHQTEASSLICLVDEVDGMNLQCAAHIFFVYPATSEVERRGLATVCRLGQENEVKVHRFIAQGTPEEAAWGAQ